MSDLAQLDLRAKGGEARVRALLEDLVEYHKGIYPNNGLALAVWFGKSPSSTEHDLLELYSGLQMTKIAVTDRISLHWKTGSNEPPFVNIHATSVDFFAKRLGVNSADVAQYFQRSEVLYFDKNLLSDSILKAFNVITEPDGLIKGWYVSSDEYSESATMRKLLSLHSQARPEIGLVKTEESSDFENCKGLLNVEVDQKWLPLSLGGLSNYTFYNDLLAGRPGYFLFEGGSLYQIQKFEVKTAPEYSTRVLEKLRDDRYPEVYLRAVHQPQQSAA